MQGTGRKEETLCKTQGQFRAGMQRFYKDQGVTSQFQAQEGLDEASSMLWSHIRRLHTKFRHHDNLAPGIFFICGIEGDVKNGPYRNRVCSCGLVAPTHFWAQRWALVHMILIIRVPKRQEIWCLAEQLLAAAEGLSILQYHCNLFVYSLL